MENNKEVTRRSFLKKAQKLAYLTPVILTVFAAGRNEALADGSGNRHAVSAAGNSGNSGNSGHGNSR